MTPQEKKDLITAKLAESLAREFAGSPYVYDGGVEVARRIMIGVSSPPNMDEAMDVRANVFGGKAVGLWEYMAPLLLSVAALEGVERELRRFQGMPLTEHVIEEVLAELGRVINAASTHETPKPPRSGSFRSTGLWGGQVAGEGDGR